MIAGLKELNSFLRDGMTVETGDALGLAMRTVVQLDGDVITFVAPGAANEAARTKHWEQVEARLKVVSDRLNGTALVPTWWIGGLYFARPLWELALGEETAWVHLLCDAGVAFGISVLGMIPSVRRQAWKLTVSVVRRRLR